jgi:lysophospholipase L1-like esterase
MKQKYLKLLISFFTLGLTTIYIYAEEASNPIKIMPLGDSITSGYILADADNPRPLSVRTGYRSHLWYILNNAGFSVDFVGSQVAGQEIVPPFDTDHEGHKGWHSNDIAERTYEYMVSSDPDIVLLHVGTNDYSSSANGVASILNQIDLYEQASGHSIRVLVAQIIDNASPNGIIRRFNENVQSLVTSRILDGDNITLVDMYRGAGLQGSDYTDRIHPNENGYYKIASVWANIIMTPYTYNPELSRFPTTIVPKGYIQSANINSAGDSIEFITSVPAAGMTF